MSNEEIARNIVDNLGISASIAAIKEALDTKDSKIKDLEEVVKIMGEALEQIRDWTANKSPYTYRIAKEALSEPIVQRILKPTTHKEMER